MNQQGQARCNPKMAICNRPDVSCWVDVTGETEQIRVLPPYISSSNKCDKTMPMNVSVNNDPVHLDHLATVANQERPLPVEMKCPSDRTENREKTDDEHQYPHAEIDTFGPGMVPPLAMIVETRRLHSLTPRSPARSPLTRVPRAA